MPRKPKTDQKRLPRTTRATTPPRFQLMPRDVELIRVILKYRFLYIEQLGWFLHSYTPRQLAYRLKLLYHGGFVERVKLPVTSNVNKLIYSMTEKGAQLLAETDSVGRDQIAWTRFHNQVTPSHVAHLLSINDVMIAYEVALAEAQTKGGVVGYRIDRGEPARNRITVETKDATGHRQEIAVVPDVILKIVFPGNQPGLFFIEVDRGTMTTRRWQDKLTVYREFMQSPKLLDRFKTDSFIVLAITTGPRRIETLARATIELGSRRGFWYVSADAISPTSALDPIWVRACDLFELHQGQTIEKAMPNNARKRSLLDAVGFDNH